MYSCFNRGWYVHRKNWEVCSFFLLSSQLHLFSLLSFMSEFPGLSQGGFLVCFYPDNVCLVSFFFFSRTEISAPSPRLFVISEVSFSRMRPRAPRATPWTYSKSQNCLYTASSVQPSTSTYPHKIKAARAKRGKQVKHKYKSIDGTLSVSLWLWNES